MKFYLIVSGPSVVPSKEELQPLEAIGEVVIIVHKGKISEIQQLKDDPEEKILGIDPDVVDWNLDIEAFKDISNVKYLVTQSTSFGWVKPEELKKKGIVVCNSPKFSTDSVAEYAICLAIEGARRLPMHLKNHDSVDWNTKPFLLKDRVLAVVGLGRIGKRVAELASGIGMKVIYWSRKSRDERFGFVELSELFRQADIICPTLIDNEETKNIISKSLLDSMKKEAVLVGINAAKNAFDENYVIEKVKKGEIGGYSFEGESAKDFKTYEGNIWAVPPIAWFTQESIENLVRIWLETILAAARGKPVNVSN